MPVSKFNSKAESNTFELLKDGDYCYEVVAFDVSISKGAKTNGADQMELKLAFFTDATFTKKVGQWTETLIFHPTTDWKISVFAKSANLLVGGKPPGDGEEVDYTADLVVGLRGWCRVGAEPSKTDPTKKFNRVKIWLTDKEKLTRNIPEAVEEPATGAEEVPW